MATISLKGLDKAKVLAALFNGARAQGMGFMQYDNKSMTREQAAKILERTAYFDYLQGRVMKVDLRGDEFDPYLYDRDNGEGAAARIIDELRKTGATNSSATQAQHHVNTLEAAEEVEDHLGEMSGPRGTMRDGTPVYRLGFDDVAEPLHRKVQEARRKIRG